MKSKVRKGGKVYNAESAREIGRNGCEALYVKQRGDCFSTDENGIKPLSIEEARAWIEEKLLIEPLKSDAYRKLPRRKPGEDKMLVKSYQTHDEKIRINKLRNERGFEAADIMVAGIEALEQKLL